MLLLAPEEIHAVFLETPSPNVGFWDRVSFFHNFKYTLHVYMYESIYIFWKAKSQL